MFIFREKSISYIKSHPYKCLICYSAPPAPISECLASTIMDTGVTVQWRNPHCGGRNDCYYLIKVNNGPPIQYIPTTVHFSAYTVEDLQPDTTYIITISVHNGVSEQDAKNAKLRECSIVVKTIKGSKLIRLLVRRFLHSSNFE